MSLAIPSKAEVIWQPQPKQMKVLRCPYDEILYGGTAGSGKSDCLLGDYLAHSQRFERAGGFAKGVLFRKTYKELSDIVERSHALFGALGWKFRKDDYTWISPKGSMLEFSYLETYEDAQGHRGKAYDWEGFDELTLWRTDAEYDYLGTRLRLESNRFDEKDLKVLNRLGIKCRRVSTTNPGGPGHAWVLKRWAIDLFPNGDEPITEKVKLESGEIKERTRVFIRGFLRDNKYYYEAGDYEAELRTKPEMVQKMLLEGRWDVYEGAFFTEWDPKVHIVKAFSIPKDGKIWMGADWGTAKPYAFVWFWEGHDGVTYLIHEMYGWSGKPNVGTYESVVDVGPRIREFEARMGWTVRQRWLDASCFDDSRGVGVCEGDIFRTPTGGNLHFQKSQKKNKTGAINLFRSYLRVVNGHTRFRIFDNCKHAIRTLPQLQCDTTNPEQYDTDGEDHEADAILYGIRRDMLHFGEDKSQDNLRRYNQRAISHYGTGGAR